MTSELAWGITGVAVALLLVLWHYVAWREISAKRTVLDQLFRQAELSRETADKLRDGPYAEGAWQSYEVSRSVYQKAAVEYNGLLHKPLYRVPAGVLGIREQPNDL